MDAFECIKTKLDIGKFSSKPVPNEVKLKVLEAARLTGSGLNRQHWRFVLVQHPENMQRLADDATTGEWVRDASFAVIILTDPALRFHQIDAGRVLQDMQLAAWNYGMISRVYTGVKVDGLRRDFKVPEDLNPTAILGFGYPVRKIIGRKSRKSLKEIAFSEEYAKPLAL